MNPPFANAPDIDHVTHALGMLKPDGVLVAMMSAGTRFCQDGKARKLRGLMQSRAAEWLDLPPDRSPRPAVASTPASSRWSRDESPRRPHRHVAYVLCSLSAAREHGPPLTAGGVVTRDEKRLRNYRAPKLLLAVFVIAGIIDAATRPKPLPARPPDPLTLRDSKRGAIQ